MGATALALAGGAPKDMPLDGVNILPHPTGKSDAAPHERLFWKEHNQGAIREGRYKLLMVKGGKKRERYDLDADINESEYVAADYPALVERLHFTWVKWNDQMPPPAWQTPKESEWTKPEYRPPLWPQEKEGVR